MGEKVVKIEKGKGKEKKQEQKPKHFVVQPHSLYHKTSTR